METIIAVLIIALVVWFAFWVIDQVPVPSPFNWIIKALIGLFAVIKVLALIGIS